jgi:hypothetical protein
MVSLNPPLPALSINSPFCESTGLSDSGKCDFQRLLKNEIQSKVHTKTLAKIVHDSFNMLYCTRF